MTEIFAFCILLMNVYWDCLLVENMNHHSVLSIFILMLIIVTVSSQDTALYIYKAYTQYIVVTALKD